MKNLKDLNFGHVRKFVTPSIIFWAIYLQDLAQNCIPMGTNCAPLVADLFWFCFEIDFMLSLYDNNQANVVEAAFNSTSRYLGDLLYIDNPYF